MGQLYSQKYWWVEAVVLVTLILDLVVLLSLRHWMPQQDLLGSGLALSWIGTSFCWAYQSDRERLWWAIIPGLVAFTLIAALFSEVLLGTGPKNDWIQVLVTGAGAAIIAAVLQRKNAKITLAIVAMFCFLVGFLMAPILIVLKLILIAMDVAVAGWYVWRVKKAEG
jgi:hypothetical protein